MRVQMTWQELMVAAQVGAMRRVGSIRRGMNKNVHASVSDWATDTNGALAEMAVAKALDIYWGAHTMTMKSPDVGSIQVRSSSHKSPHLIVRHNDADNELFILVQTSPPDCEIIGYLSGADAKRPEYWRQGTGEGVGAWWVPHDKLKSFSSYFGGQHG